jgi:hypothetical protein
MIHAMLLDSKKEPKTDGPLPFMHISCLVLLILAISRLVDPDCRYCNPPLDRKPRTGLCTTCSPIDRGTSYAQELCTRARRHNIPVLSHYLADFNVRDEGFNFYSTMRHIMRYRMYRAAAAASSLACIFFIHKLLYSIAPASEYPVIVKDNF